MKKPLISIITLCIIFLSIACTQEVATTPAVKEFLKNSQKPAVLEFYAEWCSSCKSYKPTFEKVRLELQDKADFFSIDVDKAENKKLINELKIAHLPVTALVSIDRERVVKQLGPMSYQSLKSKVENLL